jgi:ankyrin repeat protein
MQRSLPARPSLAQLRRQAKDLFRLAQAGQPDAIDRLCTHHPRLARLSPADVTDTGLALHHAQLVLAREYGFASWPKLKQHVEGLQRVEDRVARLRAAFAEGDRDTRERLLACVHSRARFKHYDPRATTLSEDDARLVVANEEGYAFWSKYESYLYLDPAVQQVIAAVRVGDLSGLRQVLRAEPRAANPHWVQDDRRPDPIPNDSIPLHCVSEGVFNGTNRRGNDYELARALIEAGAEVDIEGGTPLNAAVSYNAAGAVRALLDGGAAVDGVRGDGAPMAYALYFGFTSIAEELARRGAKLDLRFAAGLGRLDVVRSYVKPDGSLRPDAGRLSDPYEDRFRCERTRANILSQALYFACLHGRLDVVTFLLDLGADLNAEVPGMEPFSCGTVLHSLTSMSYGAGADDESTERQRLPTVELLLRRGASVTVKDVRFQSTPLGWARYHGRPLIAALLEEHGAI